MFPRILSCCECEEYWYAAHWKYCTLLLSMEVTLSHTKKQLFSPVFNLAGGIPAGSGVLETLVRECEEEASMPPELARKAKAVGTIRCVTASIVSPFYLLYVGCTIC